MRWVSFFSEVFVMKFKRFWTLEAELTIISIMNSRLSLVFFGEKIHVNLVSDDINLILCIRVCNKVQTLVAELPIYRSFRQCIHGSNSYFAVNKMYRTWILFQLRRVCFTSEDFATKSQKVLNIEQCVMRGSVDEMHFSTMEIFSEARYFMSPFVYSFENRHFLKNIYRKKILIVCIHYKFPHILWD